MLIAPLLMQLLIWNFLTLTKIYQAVWKCKNKFSILYHVQGVSNFSRPPFEEKNIFSPIFFICQILFAYRNQLLERALCTKFQLNRSRNDENRDNWKLGLSIERLSMKSLMTSQANHVIIFQKFLNGKLFIGGHYKIWLSFIVIPPVVWEISRGP